MKISAPNKNKNNYNKVVVMGVLFLVFGLLFCFNRDLKAQTAAVVPPDPSATGRGYVTGYNTNTDSLIVISPDGTGRSVPYNDYLSSLGINSTPPAAPEAAAAPAPATTPSSDNGIPALIQGDGGVLINRSGQSSSELIANPDMSTDIFNSTGDSAVNANGSNNGLSTSGVKPTSSVGSTGACVGGGMLAKLLASSISSSIKKIGKSAVSTVSEMATHVPVTNVNTDSARNQEATTNAHTGTFLFGAQVGVSWDAVAWCIVNTIIDYIVQSTIAWANSGFKGNPAFIRNPGEFFKSLADQTASQFIREIAYDTTGIDVCKPFRAVIATGLAGSYAPTRNIASCSLTQLQQSMMQSTYTITTPTDWLALTRPQNNPYYSYIQAGSELQKRIDVKNNTARFDLTINRGFLSQKKCKDDSKPESKTNPCDVTTPGSVIADSLSQTLNIPKQKLVSAQRFDQMVDAIVNNLIKIALSKVLEGVTGVAPSAAVASDYYTVVANNAVGAVGTGGTTGGRGGTIVNNALSGMTFPPSSGLSNDQVLQMINDSGLLNLPVPSDAAQYFPGGVPTAQGYLSLLASIANSESGFNPNDGMNHAATDVGNTYSEGLFSLTPTNAIVQRLGFGSDTALANPANNTQSAIAILQNQIQSTGSIAGSSGNHYWGPLYRGQ